MFELPLISGEELQDITRQLLSSGADISSINTIRKRLSRVKGGRNQELALAAAEGIGHLEKDVAIFSVGSDGTDEPTDAAGGYVDI